jgi:hypothetical protein
VIVTSGSTGSRVSRLQPNTMPINTNIAPDGYISFPDYERFCQGQGPYETREHSAVKT